MSNQLILEIQEFNGGQSFKTGIYSFEFPQFAHISGGMAGTTKKMSEKLTMIKARRDVDQYSPLFVNQRQKIFPKVMLRTSSREGKSFIFTFHKARLDYYSLNRESGAIESTEELSFSFSEFTVKDESPKAEPTGHNRRPKTGDKVREQTSNLIRG